MEIKDVIHYYLGCDCLFDNKRYNIIRVGKMVRMKRSAPVCDGDGQRYNEAWPQEIKLILRRLEDMTDDDRTEISKRLTWYADMQIINDKHFDIRHSTNQKMVYDALVVANENMDDRLGPRAYFELMPYLTSRGFDLFNLIPRGLAIDSTIK